MIWCTYKIIHESTWLCDKKVRLTAKWIEAQKIIVGKMVLERREDRPWTDGYMQRQRNERDSHHARKASIKIKRTLRFWEEKRVITPEFKKRKTLDHEGWSQARHDITCSPLDKKMLKEQKIMTHWYPPLPWFYYFHLNHPHQSNHFQCH